MTNPLNGRPFERTELFTRLLWHLLQLVVTIIVAGGIYFRLDNRVTNNTTAIDANTKSISDIDNRGTRKSHEATVTQDQEINELNRRVTNLENILRDLVPKVERIDTNVLVLMARENKK